MTVLIGLIATGILLICVIIHFKSHFTLNICCGFTNINNLITPRQKSLAFYPSLFTLYLLYLFLLSSCIIAMERGIFDIENRFVTWIICYAIIMASCWESLFSFHRYYTLKQYMDHSHRTKIELILKKFAGFASVYVLCFVCQLHFIYWLFPFMIIMYVWSNIFWQYQFVQMLLKQYSTHSTFDNVSASNIQDTMIRSVYIMGYCSISSTIISSLSVFTLSVFCAFDTNYIGIQFGDAMYHIVSPYFPVFWCGSAFFYMFNFVRNRAFFTSCRNVCTINCCRSDNNHVQNTNKKPQTPATPVSITPTAQAPHTPQNVQTDSSSTNNKANVNQNTLQYIIERAADQARDTNTSTQNVSETCHPAAEHTLNNSKLTLRSLKSDATLYDESASNRAPPTSLVSICDHCDDISSDEADAEYRLHAIRIPVSRRQSSTNVSIMTDSSGYLSPPEQKTPYVLDEKTEFIVPLAIIKDTQMNDGTVCIQRLEDKGDTQYINKEEYHVSRARHSSDSSSMSSIVILRDRMLHNRVYTDFVRNAMERHKCKPLQAVSSLSSQSTISVSSDGDPVVRSVDAIQHTMLQRHPSDHINKSKSCNFVAVRMDLDDEDIETATNKSRALTDLMIQYGWTDEDVLCVLRRGYTK